jgi:N-acetylneuraminate synthase
MAKEFNIGKIRVGLHHPPYFIADIAANHDGSLERAFKLIELAKEAGAHAAKFQNFKADKIVSKRGFEMLGGQLSHQAKWKKSVFEIYQDASISPDWTPLLKEKCLEVDIEYFTSPYDFESVDQVDPFVEVYKIGSGDITWLEIIEYIAEKKKPVLLATGAANMADVERAMEVLLKNKVHICLMQCNTNYTLEGDKYKYVNLNVLDTYTDKYPDILLGLSDHTLNFATTAGAVAKGARIIEKHFTDDNGREGPDHKFAINPERWRQMVDVCNEIFYSLGDGIKRVEDNEQQSIIVQQRSLRAAKDLKAGHIVLESDLIALRPKPDGSFEPYRKMEITGKKLLRDLTSGDIIQPEDLQ